MYDKYPLNSQDPSSLTRPTPITVKSPPPAAVELEFQMLENLQCKQPCFTPHETIVPGETARL